MKWQKTPAGVEYGLWGSAATRRAATRPAPLLFVLAGTIEGTLGKAYFRQCGNQLVDHGYLCVSIDLPCHGTQTRDDEPPGLGGWSHRAAKEDDFVAECNARLSNVLDHLIKTGVADPQRIAACGTSRGGFLAIHFAAYDSRVKCAAAFAPVTDLALLREFNAIKRHPFIARLSLGNQADKLAGRPVWIVIGDQDRRVGTDSAIQLADKLNATSRERNLGSRVKLHVMPEPRGHTTPRGSAELAATWVHRELATVSATSVEQANTASTPYFDEMKAITLFAFDNVSIPFTQNLKLEMGSPKRHSNNPVVRRGPAGSCDSWAVQFYGSVIRIEDKFSMWYVAVGDDRLDADVPRSSPWRVAYAESKDGVKWTKPNLGLVEYNGNRNNNLVRMDPRLGTINVKVLYDADDPDPDRRYKMGAHVWFPKNDVRLGTLAPYASKDGRRWKLLIDATPVEHELPQKNMVLPALHFEPVGGLYKWDGLYHLSGQNAIIATRPYHGRVVRKFVSADFVKWSKASSVGFVRSSQHDLLGPGRSREGEQTHEGVSVWNRGNVLIGLSGMWHGAKDWADVTIDLGLVLSNDGLHFREPAHEHVFLRRGADGQWDEGGLLQGQGFENVGEQTYIYYGAWDPRRWQDAPPRGGIGIATLPRDRFADLIVDKTTQGGGNYQMSKTVSNFITRTLTLGSDSRRFYVNASGLGDESTLKIELLDHKTLPLPPFSGENAAVVKASGFQTPILWNGKHRLDGLPDRVRVKATFEGKRKTSIRFNALYVK